MTKALFFTAFDRPELLRLTLDTWLQVRGIQTWPLVARIEPGPRAEECAQVFQEFFQEIENPRTLTVINPMVYGVLHHPWVGFEELFLDYDFVVRTEDDLCVSDDILDYFTWAEQEFRAHPRIASIHGFSMDLATDSSKVESRPAFNPLVWGTWRSTWRSIISPTWDHDYSTYNGSPGNQSGWDWNLNTRVYPKHQLQGIYPLMSRVRNIGVYGTHSTPENFYDATSFYPEYGQVDYRFQAARPGQDSEAEGQKADILGM